VQTPRAPPLPVAAMLSPILWQLNNPDRFDMYSVGVLLLQMSMPVLRSDSALINFRRKLEQCNFDLSNWRRQQVRLPVQQACDEIFLEAQCLLLAAALPATRKERRANGWVMLAF